MRHLTLLLTLAASAAAAQDRPAMDDFYARTRARHVGFEDCAIGYCDGKRLLQALIGAQVANPSTDALDPALAEGIRLGLDAGIRGGYAIARARAWADLLWVGATGDRLTEYVGQVTGFLPTARGNGLGVHLQLDAEIAAREELEPQDFAEFQRSPYSAFDVEAEVALVGPKVDKEAFIALPFGIAHRVRWRDVSGGAITEERRTTSGALALRAFQKRNRFHYQLEVARLTHMHWELPAGTAQAWRTQLGYQQVSPDLPGIQLWLLFGWAWVDGSRDDDGFITRIGIDVDFNDLDGGGLGPHLGAAHYQRDFTLARDTLRFRAVDQVRLYYGTTAWSPVRMGMGYEMAAVDAVGALHVLEPKIGWQPFADLGLEIGAAVRLRVHSSAAVDAAVPTGQRFQLQMDWLL